MFGSWHTSNISRFTFSRVLKKKSTEKYSCVPYIMALFNCVLYTWYGLPVVSYKWENFPVVTINGLGILLELSFIMIYFYYAPADGKASSRTQIIRIWQPILSVLCIQQTWIISSMPVRTLSSFFHVSYCKVIYYNYLTSIHVQAQANTKLIIWTKFNLVQDLMHGRVMERRALLTNSLNCRKRWQWWLYLFSWCPLPLYWYQHLHSMITIIGKH